MPASAKPLTVSAEDYLERIHELIETKGYARVSDIAALLELTRPTVSIMVQRLSRDGYIVYEKYRGLTLTPLGAEAARRIRTRHVLLTEFLGMLGLDRSVISRDVEGIEHHVSPGTLEKLERLVDHWKRHPARLRAALTAVSGPRKRKTGGG
ncbi:MAG: transcriptional regulator MntR [Terrimicrobiaceae bacterium]|nr:transcriptional regulator MntR [Terrimicrobiaceae bacterium]